MIHFLYCPFTGLGLFGGYRGDTWLKNRIKVFKEFVVPSILNQTNRDFILWLSFRPEEEKNPIVKDLVNFLDKIAGVATVVTYSGIIFWDDKYPDDVASKRLLKSLSGTMEVLKPLVGKNDVLMTIQPSDDMYLGDAMQRIKDEFKKNKKAQAVGFTKGYMANYGTLEVAEYDPKTNPPFYTIKFSSDEFTDPNRHYNYTGPYKSHEFVPDNLVYVPVNDYRGFVVGTHGENISTVWTHPFRGKRCNSNTIFAQCGHISPQALPLKKDLNRRIKKRIINMLPAPLQRYIIRKQSPGVTNSIKNYFYFNL